MSKVTYDPFADMAHDPYFADMVEDKAVDVVDMVVAKNRDYGNSFEKLVNKYGMVALAIRFADKFNRLDSLVKNGRNYVPDETLEDTLKDIAGYALLGLVLLEKWKNPNPCREIKLGTTNGGEIKQNNPNPQSNLPDGFEQLELFDSYK